MNVKTIKNKIKLKKNKEQRVVCPYGLVVCIVACIQVEVSKRAAGGAELVECRRSYRE